MSSAATPSPLAPSRWQLFAAATVRAYHGYANWLVGISWKRFFLLSLLLLVLTGILQSLPPFSWSVTETIVDSRGGAKPPAPPRKPLVKIEKPKPGADSPEGIEITIDERGIRISPRAAPAASTPPAAPAASAPQGAAATVPTGPGAPAASGVGAPAPTAPAPRRAISISLPAEADRDTVRDAVRAALQAAREAKADAAEAVRGAKADAAEAERDVKQAARDIAEAQRDIAEVAADAAAPSSRIRRTRHVNWGEWLPQLAMLWIIASAIVKITYRLRIQAEARADAATETAGAESLKRQVVEARMAAMQAQVEPHFLFNTLASIDHLIETDPQRASLMQKNLIALLRASMPTLREASDGGVRELGRELAVIRPYLEILKVRMEDRLVTEVQMPVGLLSAEFPPMMLQTLVENAIKHGLEPKPEGGRLLVKAEVVHGKLAVSVADTGLGFGMAATAGTGVGLANIRERLQLLYNGQATLTVTENAGGGTVATITVPYRTVEGACA